jgi:hypothetical protein
VRCGGRHQNPLPADKSAPGKGPSQLAKLSTDVDLQMEYLGAEYIVMLHCDELHVGLVRPAPRQRPAPGWVSLRCWLATKLHRPAVRADSPAAASKADMARSPLAELSRVGPATAAVEWAIAWPRVSSGSDAPTLRIGSRVLLEAR